MTAAVLTAAVFVCAPASAQVSDSLRHPPVNAVVSPPLREIPPKRATSDPPKPRNRRRLPYKGAIAGAIPSRFVDSAVQSAPGVSAPAPAGVNFDGLPANGFAPPDPSGKVGPSHYVTWINSEFAVYDKAGTLLYGPTAGNALFASLGGVCAAQNDGDPVVQYDALADRWILSQFAVRAPAPAASHECVAVSRTGDPLGAFYLYDFPTDTTNFVDYPKLTVWTDAYYMTAHLFNPGTTVYLGPMLYAFDRTRMLAGLPAQIQSVNLDAGGNMFGQLVADFDGLTLPPASSPAYVFAPASPDWDGSASPGLHFWTASSTWGPTPTLTVTAKPDIPTAAYTTDLCGFAPACLPQPGTAQLLDALTGQLMFRAAYRNNADVESIVLSHTVNALVPPANQAAVRWYEIRTPGATPTVFQQSTYAPTAAHRWVPSIAMDASGDMAVGYSVTDATTTFPSINISGRLAGDAPGALGAELTMFAGLGSQTSGLNRWGDYTQMDVDPRDGCSFWYINQYQPATGAFNWKTRIASFRFPSCVPPARGTITGLVRDAAGNPIANALVQVDAGYSGATDGTGRYVIIVAPGSYNVTATDPGANCTPSSSQAAIVTAGVSTTLNFTLTGSARFAARAITIDDSIGNNNGVINRNECFRIAVEVENDGCADAGSISATLTTATPGVVVVSGSASYGSLPRTAHAPGTPVFALATTPAFVCGTDIAFTLTVSSPAGGNTIDFSLPTCATQAVFTGAVTPASPVEKGRLNRFAPGSTCAGRACPGDAAALANRNFASHTFTNVASVPRCVTVTATTSGCPSAAQQVSPVAYLGSFDPNVICTNYLGDAGASPTPGPVSFDIAVASGQSVVLVMQAAFGTPLFTGCGSYTLAVTGLLDESDAGRPTPAASNDGPTCEGATIGLSTPAVAGAVYAWTGPNGFASALRNPTFPGATAANAGVYSVTVTAAGCLSGAGTTTVVVNAAPAAPVITAPAVVGAGSPNRVASVVGTVGSTWAWTISNGIITAGQGTNQITFTAGIAGTLSLSVVETSAASCASAPATKNVSVATVGSGVLFYSVAPCRVLDTRSANPPALAASASRVFPVAAPSCGIPSTATSISVNVTVAKASAGGFLALDAGDRATPGTTSINFAAGQTRANNSVVRLSADGAGTIGVFNGSAGPVDFILDVNGFFE